MNQIRVGANLVVLGAALLAPTGCSTGGSGGQATFKVSGVVTRNGVPLTVGPNGTFSVTFVDASNPALVYPAEGNEGMGRFIAFGVPAGKYRVAVEQLDPHPNDLLKGVYSPQKTTIEREIVGNSELEIKLPK